MPAGLKWSPERGRWVKDNKQELYYEGFDADSWGLLISYWRWYPDKFLDAMEGDNPKYSLEIIQRMFIRIMARYPEVFISASRGTTKSFCAMCEEKTRGILWPGIVDRYAGPAKEQLAQIVEGIERDILTQYPGLADYWSIVSKGKDSFEMDTACGSVISIKTNRGDTCNGCVAEEVAQSDKGKAFDHEHFRSAILPAIRGQRMINRVQDPLFRQFSKRYITSAGSVYNESYEYRTPVVRRMCAGDDTAFALDVPSEVAVLSRIRTVSWRDDLKSKLTAEEWLREMDSIWTGNSDNPLISEKAIVASKNLLTMEDSHCGDPNVFYIIGYDVSYADGAKNAKCATSVMKCELQTSEYKKTRYLKSIVYVTDSPPPPSATQQARILKQIWKRYCIDGGQPAYISVDSNQYGRAVTEELHKEMNDGLPRMCCINHDFPELEVRDALPIIYAIHATPGVTGTHDPDGEMIRYMEVEFEQGNVRLLTSNTYEGVENYKRKWGIKDDEMDAKIAVPYRKTKEMVSQISNLRKKASGFGFREERSSKSIQRDMWSATKYAGRLASILEYENLVKDPVEKSSWSEEIEKMSEDSGFTAINPAVIPNRPVNMGSFGGVTTVRRGGNRLH